MQKGSWVYVLTNKNHTVLYTGVTSNLVARIQEHIDKIHISSFAARYNVMSWGISVYMSVLRKLLRKRKELRVEVEWRRLN